MHNNNTYLGTIYIYHDKSILKTHPEEQYHGMTIRYYTFFVDCLIVWIYLSNIFYGYWYFEEDLFKEQDVDIKKLMKMMFRRWWSVYWLMSCTNLKKIIYGYWQILSVGISQFPSTKYLLLMSVFDLLTSVVLCLISKLFLGLNKLGTKDWTKT
jgi:hypothetical protein